MLFWELIYGELTEMKSYGKGLGSTCLKTLLRNDKCCLLSPVIMEWFPTSASLLLLYFPCFSAWGLMRVSVINNTRMRFCRGTEGWDWETRYDFSLFYPDLKWTMWLACKENGEFKLEKEILNCCLSKVINSSSLFFYNLTTPTTSLGNYKPHTHKMLCQWQTTHTHWFAGLVYPFFLDKLWPIVVTMPGSQA